MSIREKITELFPIRKTRKQKEAFRDWFIDWARSQGYTAQATTPRGMFHSTNVVVGDPATADVTFTAHYDTPACMIVPNFITPCNGCTFRLVQGDDTCYEIEIMGNTLTIPTAFTGLYELQIVSGEYIFYTEIEL